MTRKLVLLALAAVLLTAVAVGFMLRFGSTPHGSALTVVAAENETAEVVLDADEIRRNVPELATAFEDALETGAGDIEDEGKVHEVCAFLVQVKPRCAGFVEFEGRTFEINVYSFG